MWKFTERTKKEPFNLFSPLKTNEIITRLNWLSGEAFLSAKNKKKYNLFLFEPKKKIPSIFIHEK